MTDATILVGIVATLLSAVALVSIAQTAGFGSVIGYLLAGVVVGPAVLGVVRDGPVIHALGEIGVILLLFGVGLELPLERIRVMPKRLYGIGAAQILVTTAILAGVVLVFGGSAGAAVAIGGGLAFSSTAIVLRVLADRRELATRFGRAAFAILILQDLSVPFVLAFLVAVSAGHDPTLLDAGLGLLKAAAGLSATLLIGRFGLLPLFRIVARTKLPEPFVGLALSAALLSALATSYAGLSAGFGAFLIGMLLAESQFRHQIAAAIEPFRGLLLGLFFMSVGMAFDLDVAVRQWFTVAALAVALILVKAAVIFAVARLFRYSTADAVYLGLLLSQAGEFGLLLLGNATKGGFITAAVANTLTASIVLTMLATPFLAAAARRIARRIMRAAAVDLDVTADAVLELSGHVVVAGFGRVGEAICRSFGEAATRFVAIEVDPERIAYAERQGIRVYFGDATRPEILAAAHIERAAGLVVALPDPAQAKRVVALAHYLFPDLPIHARAHDAGEAEELHRLGARAVVPEGTVAGRALAAKVLGRPD
jgi:monovalent cation:H+ antiporter-2, CPA2 family